MSDSVATYEVSRTDGSTILVTVPEDDENEFAEAIQENLSPEAVAAIAAYLQPCRTNDPLVDRQVAWFREQLCEILGGELEQTELAEQIGL